VRFGAVKGRGRETEVSKKRLNKRSIPSYNINRIQFPYALDYCRLPLVQFRLELSFIFYIKGKDFNTIDFDTEEYHYIILKLFPHMCPFACACKVPPTSAYQTVI
jgi:hypothetical protein